MSIEDAIEARVRAIDLITARVGDQVAWGRRLAGAPAISMQLVADPRPQHFKGFQFWRPTLIQIDVLARTAAEARALRDALIAGLAEADSVSGVRFRRAEILNVRGSAVDQQGADLRIRPEIFRESIDIRFWHNG